LETNNTKILEDRFNHYNYLINAVGEALSGIPYEPGETADSIADRIEEILKKKFGNEESPD